MKNGRLNARVDEVFCSIEHDSSDHASLLNLLYTEQKGCSYFNHTVVISVAVE